MNMSTSPYKSSRSHIQKMKTKVTLVKAIIVIHKKGTWKYIIIQNIDNDSKGASRAQGIHAYIIVYSKCVKYEK